MTIVRKYLIHPSCENNGFVAWQDYDHFYDKKTTALIFHWIHSVLKPKFDMEPVKPKFRACSLYEFKLLKSECAEFKIECDVVDAYTTKIPRNGAFVALSEEYDKIRYNHKKTQYIVKLTRQNNAVFTDQDLESYKKLVKKLFLVK